MEINIAGLGEHLLPNKFFSATELFFNATTNPFFKANSTGFLVKNYENLTDTNIEAFFQEFKTQLKSVKIKSSNTIEFVKGKRNRSLFCLLTVENPKMK